ncbi:MAG: acetyl-CoA carboxylase biotin carboxyl carrier protein [Candidatus Korobacteraceae bacterium]
MNQKELRELIEFLVEKDIAEFEMERGDLKLHVKRGAGAPMFAPPVPQAIRFTPVSEPMVAPPPPSPAAAQSPAAPAAAAAPSEDANLHILKSPMVGTFYEAPSPGAPPFVAVGSSVKEGQVLCIIEAMKLMNEIEADATGEIVKMFVSNGAPVEYGMPLFGIRKS